MQKVSEELQELQEFLESEELELSEATSNNPHEWWIHYAERDLDNCTVYEYRNLEGEKLHYDVYHYSNSFVNFYFVKQVHILDVPFAANFHKSN